MLFIACALFAKAKPSCSRKHETVICQQFWFTKFQKFRPELERLLDTAEQNKTQEGGLRGHQRHNET